MFAKHHGTTASFALQPFAPWMSKALTTQETQLFALLDKEGEGFSLVLKELTDYKKKYSQDLRTICSRVGMKYLDLNEAPALQQPERLFVDRAHLTDEGYDMVAKILMRELAL
jgi:lysophospholipase L1-like esterase